MIIRVLTIILLFSSSICAYTYDLETFQRTGTVMSISGLYLGFSIYMREVLYKSNKSKNWMNWVNCILGLALVGATLGVVAGTIISHFQHSNYFIRIDGLVTVFLALFGFVVGIIVGIALNKFSNNPFIYYVCPVTLTILIPVLTT